MPHFEKSQGQNYIFEHPYLLSGKLAAAVQFIRKLQLFAFPTFLTPLRDC